MEILLVDDEPLSRTATGNFLGEELGHEVFQCTNGYEATQLLKNKQFPLIISDIRMPKMDGLELLKHVKQSNLCTDVVLITGHGDMDTAIKALRYGAYDFIKKPIDVEELAAAVTRSMERHALIIENRELKKKFETPPEHFSITLNLPSKGQKIEKIKAIIVQQLLTNFNNDKLNTAKYLGVSLTDLEHWLNL